MPYCVDGRCKVIFTDGIHMVSRSKYALHEFAKKIGLKKEWFQNKKYPHYDLTTKRMVDKAIKNGAIKINK
jgi:hypothetical protein